MRGSTTPGGFCIVEIWRTGLVCCS